jgi:dephospho-CoA kinase
MKILGIVGGIGAGKSTVVNLIEELANVYTIDADKIGHSLLLPDGKAYEKVKQAFGNEVLDSNGYILRPKLGKIVFSDKQALETLNAITHPLILETVKDIIISCQADKKWAFILIDAALLIEIGLVQLVDEVIGVYANEEERLARIVKRDRCSIEDALKRISVQKKWEELKQICTVVIDNSFTYEATKQQIEACLKQW